MSQVIFTKTTSTGQTVEVRLQEVLPGQFSAQVYLDGMMSPGPSRPQALQQARGEVTHFLGQTPAVGLTMVEARQIQTALEDAALAAQQTPAGRLRARRAERESLVAEYLGLQDEAKTSFERGMQSDGSAAWQAKQRFDARIKAARDAIQTFDAAHPELMDAINAEKAEETARFLATD